MLASASQNFEGWEHSLPRSHTAHEHARTEVAITEYEVFELVPTVTYESMKEGLAGELKKCKDHLNGDQYELLSKALEISNAVLALCGGLKKKQASIAAQCEAAEGEVQFMKRFLGRCHSHQCEDNRVQLNVSGKAMETFRSTLLWQEGSTLAAKFGSAWTVQSEEMVDGGVFFDEDPSLFTLLLLHLRLGSMLGESFVPRVPDEKLGAWQRFIKYLNLEDVLTPDGMKLDSLVLAGLTDELKQLSEWLPKKKTTLLFRATRDGFAPANFHQKCDGKGPTVVIAKSAGGHIFGGYTENAWDNSSNWKNCSDSFLFRLSGPGGVGPSQHRIQNFQYGMYCNFNYGPTFGGGHDMHFNNAQVSFDLFGNSYNQNGFTFLAESQNATCHNFITTQVASWFFHVTHIHTHDPFCESGFVQQHIWLWWCPCPRWLAQAKFNLILIRAGFFSVPAGLFFDPFRWLTITQARVSPVWE